MRLIYNWIVSAAFICLIALFVPGVSVAGFGAALQAAFVIGLLNAILKPILSLLFFPLTILTLGLFSLVINALMFTIASNMLSGFAVDSLGTGILACIIMGILNCLFLKKDDRKREA